MSRDRVLVIGLDGGSLDIIGPLARQGLMPNLARLISEGRSGSLRSTVPWYTIPGWASLMTGVRPTTHGLLNWVMVPEGEYFEDRRQGRRFVTSADLGRPTFWDIAGAAGRRVSVVNMPMTYPAWQVNGTMITGFLTPGDAPVGTCYPSDLLSRFPGYQVDLTVSRGAEGPDASRIEGLDLPAYLRELVGLTEMRGLVGEELLKDDVDLGVVVFVGTDRVSHKAWPEQAALVEGRAEGEIGELVEAFYRTLDGAVGRLLEGAGPEATVMVVCDHGFGPPPERTFQMNAWLREMGYLKVPMSGAQRAAASNPRVVRRLLRPLARRVRRRYRVPGQAGLVDWSRSAAYAVFYSRTPVCGIVVNAVGKRRQGAVPAEEVPSVLRRLESELMQIRDPNGERVIRAVHRVDGGRSDLPDLFVELEDDFAPGDGLLRPALFGEFERQSGLHARDGVFLLSGPRVRGGGPVRAEIEDVAPTALALLGIQPPGHMEGHVVRDALELPSSLDIPPDVGPPGSGTAELTATEQGEIEAHLQALGYVE